MLSRKADFHSMLVLLPSALSTTVKTKIIVYKSVFFPRN